MNLATRPGQPEQSEGSQLLIVVGPVEGGWHVTCDFEEGLVFFSGGRAESQARTLARCVASLGRTATVEIHDRKNLLIGAIRYLPEASS